MRVIGLISGTSVDGIDAALVDLSGTVDDLTVRLIAGETYPYPEALRAKILGVCGGASLSMAELAALDDAIAESFAQAAQHIQATHPAERAELIGSHGQTVYHRPPNHRPPNQSAEMGYSLQIGRGALIAHLTQMTTVSNFRAADIAVGGQGAPLVSPIDVCLLRHPTLDRCIQNVGGIGNVTYLPARASVQSTAAPTIGQTDAASTSLAIRGWDTGPGNVLLDLAVQQLSQGALQFDQDGAWAAGGKPCQALVQAWLQQDFFQQPPPKSTGRERFGQDYLTECLQDAAALSLSHTDILATLTELTAASIAHSYRQFLPQLPHQVVLCGGGSRNLYLKHRLQANLKLSQVCTTDDLELNADFKEAIAFAVLAYWRNQGIPGNLPEVTGAKRLALLGEIHPGNSDLA